MASVEEEQVSQSEGCEADPSLEECQAPGLNLLVTHDQGGGVRLDHLIQDVEKLLFVLEHVEFGGLVQATLDVVHRRVLVILGAGDDDLRLFLQRGKRQVCRYVHQALRVDFSLR